MSRRITFREARRCLVSRATISLSSSGTLSRVVVTKSLVSSLSHTLRTMSKTSFMAVVAKSLMANRNVGQVVAKGATRKVMALEDQTFRWRSDVACSDVILYIRKDVGVRPLLSASSVGLGAATLISWAVVISATAVRILVRRNSWDSGFLASPSNGMAISFPPGRRSHSLTVARWMLSKMEVGVASWIGGIGPRENLSIVLRAGCFPVEEQSFSISSRRSEIVSFLVGRAGVSRWGGGAVSLLAWGLVRSAGVGGVCVSWVFAAGDSWWSDRWGICMSGSVASRDWGVFTLVHGKGVGEGWEGGEASLWRVGMLNGGGVVPISDWG